MRNLFATTAIVSLLAAPALAQDNSQVSDKMPNSVVDLSDRATLYVFDVTTLGQDRTSGYLASNMMGKTIYTSNSGDAEIVGDVNDFVIDESGQIAAVIVGAGGWLGLGEKDVALDFDRLTLNAADDGTDMYRITTDATRQELEQAEAYERPANATDTSGMSRDTGTRDTHDQSAGIVDSQPVPEKERENWMGDREKLTTDTLTADTSLGATVYDSSWNNVGDIGDIVMSTEGRIDAAIVDVGGFLGIGEKPVAVVSTRLRSIGTMPASSP